VDAELDAFLPVSRNALTAFLETLRARGLFEKGAALAVSRAPGRLDVMGGIADYSGSLVLQRPIAEAAFAAVQRIERPVLEVVSLGRPPCTIPLASLAPDGVPLGYEDARRMFANDGGTPVRCRTGCRTSPASS
jgi:galactokinase